MELDTRFQVFVFFQEKQTSGTSIFVFAGDVDTRTQRENPNKHETPTAVREKPGTSPPIWWPTFSLGHDLGLPGNVQVLINSGVIHCVSCGWDSCVVCCSEWAVDPFHGKLSGGPRGLRLAEAHQSRTGCRCLCCKGRLGGPNIPPPSPVVCVHVCVCVCVCGLAYVHMHPWP